MPLCLHKTTWQLVPSLDITRVADPTTYYVQPDLSRVAGEPDKRFWVVSADEFNGPDLMPEADRLPIRKADKLKDLARWYSETLAEGVAAGGYILHAETAHRNSFGNAMAAVLNMIAQGAPGAAPFLVYDRSGAPHETTLSGFQGIMAEYTQSIVEVETEYAGYLGQIAAAADKAALDAIVFGGQA